MQLDPKVEAGRICDGYYGSKTGKPYGAFRLHGPCGVELMIMVGSARLPEAESWEHVSVSTRDRCPNWTEMTWVKRLFWEPEACVVQFMPPEADYINCHPHTLHMWRSTRVPFPMPPKILV